MHVILSKDVIQSKRVIQSRRLSKHVVLSLSKHMGVMVLSKRVVQSQRKALIPRQRRTLSLIPSQRRTLIPTSLQHQQLFTSRNLKNLAPLHWQRHRHQMMMSSSKTTWISLTALGPRTVQIRAHQQGDARVNRRAALDLLRVADHNVPTQRQRASSSRLANRRKGTSRSALYT